MKSFEQAWQGLNTAVKNFNDASERLKNIDQIIQKDRDVHRQDSEERKRQHLIIMARLESELELAQARQRPSGVTKMENLVIQMREIFRLYGEEIKKIEENSSFSEDLKRDLKAELEANLKDRIQKLA